MSIKAIGASTTIFVSGLFFAVLAYKRNAVMISFFIGAISNGILSKVLKKLIQQTRPIELYQPPTPTSTSTSSTITTISSPNDDKPTDHGMPSSHAMSLGFIATFIVCHIRSLQIPLFLYTIISLYYRVQVKLHTYQQVMVGTILGSTNGFIWYRLCIGRNPFHIHIMNLVQRYLFHNQEQLPIPYLIVPLLVGAATIGSFERRISALLRKKKKVL
jgi:membrane-associated phospholipid phosphatase